MTQGKARGWRAAGLLAVLACASPKMQESRSVVRVEVAPAELAILQVEDRSADNRANLTALREAIASAAVDAGFSPLARPYVDQAEIDLDVPSLGDAGVLRVRLLEWQAETGPPGELRGWVHVSLYCQGELQADYQYSIDLRTDHWVATVGAQGQLTALRRQFASELVARLPPPPELDQR